MARTKKQLREKFSKKIALHTQLLKTSSKTVNRGVAPIQDLLNNNTQHQADAAFTPFPDLQSMTFNFTWPETEPVSVHRPELSAVFLRQAVVLVEDIIKSPEKGVVSMVKKQLSKGSPGSKSPARICQSPEGRDGSARRKCSASEDRWGDGPSSSSAGNKNIFEQFSLGRKSPRKGGTSPGPKLSGSAASSDWPGTQCASEDRQHENIATAVRALRGLSGKAVDGQGSQSGKQEGARSRKSSPRNTAAGGQSRPTSPCRRTGSGQSTNSSPGRKDSRTFSRNTSPVYKDSDCGCSGHSRTVSPSSSSPRGHSNCTSPKRHSPRILSEKMSPPGAAPIHKCLKARKSPSASAAGSDCSDSPTPGKAARSPRRASEGLTSPLSSPHSGSSRGYENQLDKCSVKSSVEGHGERSCFKGDKPTAKGEKFLSSGFPEERTIHILSSTGGGSRIIQLDTPFSSSSATRQLFVETEPENYNLSPKQNQQFSPSKNNVRSGMKKQVLEFCEPKACSSTASETACPTCDETESLLCAMLVGGSEVTKSYEQSRDHNSSAQMMRSSSNPEQLNESFHHSRDSFFDDDTADDFAETKPYELPVLGHLPPLPQPNLDVLDLVEKENLSHTDLSSDSIQDPASSGKKNMSLLALISRVKDRLPSSDEACQDAILCAEEVLQQQKESVQNADTSLSGADENPSKRTGVTVSNCAPSKLAVLINEKPCENITLSEHCEPSRSVVTGTVSVHNTPQSPSSVLCADRTSEKKHSIDTSVPVSNTTTGSATPMVDDDLPGSPGSLGELDTAMMTQAASLVVQRPVSSPLTVHSVEYSEVVSGVSALSDVHRGSIQSVPGHTNKLPQGQLQYDTKTSQSSSPMASWQSSSGGAGATLSHTEPQSSSKVSGNSKSSFRSFFNRISSPSKMRWKPKVETTTNTGRPSWSKWHKIVSPLPMEILNRHEQEATSSSSRSNKASAFSSKKLDLYLRQASNRFVLPACKDSKLAKFLVAEGFISNYEELQRQINEGVPEDGVMDKSVGGEGISVKSEDEEEGDEDERDYEISKKLDPDFDEVGGLVFVSFPSEIGVKAHTNVESCLQWETDPLAYINMAKFHAFEESRRREGKIRRQSQGLRGQHMKWRKYQRLYRKELRRLIEENSGQGGQSCPLNSSKTVPEKTADVQKIKNWKNKLGDEMKAEDLMALELLGEEEEERVVRKRKTYVFSSKKKKPKRPDSSNTASTPKANPNPNPAKVVSRSYTPNIMKEEKVAAQQKEQHAEEVDNDLDPHGEVEEEEEEEEDEEEGDNYGTPIPIDQDDYMCDVRSSIEEMRQKEKGLRHSKGIFARFKMGPEDRHIFKKLGGWVTRFRRFRRMPPEMKLEGDGRLPRKRKSKKGRGKPSFELQTVSVGLAMWSLRTLQMSGYALESGTGAQVVEGLRHGGDERGCEVTTDSPSSKGVASLGMAEEGVEMVDLTSEETTTTPEQKLEKRHCDKPGCRYGCICHLCLPSTESDETEAPGTSTPVKGVCDKEYCRLGCICDSLEKSGSRSSLDRPSTPQPGKMPSPSNVVSSTSKDGKCSKEENGMHQLTSIKQETPLPRPPSKPSPSEQTESSGDELPTLEKTAPRRQRTVDRYSNLPRRQTSYRMAKNLDAVSRKAMMMWETSEVYSEQTNRRKKTPESAGASAVTSSPCVTPSPPVMSSSSTPSSTPTTTTHILPGGSTVTAGVSVNTLPALMTTLPVTMVTMPPPPVTPNGRTTGHWPAQETSPVVVSDEEGKADVPDTAAIPKYESKRSRMKKRLFSIEGEEDVRVKKPKTTSTSTVVSTPASCTTAHTQPKWHSSLICLKASNPANSANVSNCAATNNNNDSSDDVMEEDEIKLFEFISNCPWERSKAKILSAITNTLKRGLYPEPRVMQIDGHRVEILPKAHRPSTIPLELRSKLPKSMYSVRVKVTEIVPSPQPQTGVNPQPHSGPTSPSSVQTPLPLSAGQRTVVIPSTAVPAFYSGVSSVQGVMPILSTLYTTTTTTSSKVILSSAGSSSSSITTTPTTSGGNVGISGLGRLQISHTKLPGPDTVGSVSKGQSVQRFKIQKECLEVSSSAASSGGGGGGTGDTPVEKKKKKKKKKRKNMDTGDDSLVPDLSNLTVSPRRSNLSFTSGGGGLPPVAKSSSSLLTNFRAPGVVIASSSSSAAALRPTTSTLISQPVPLRPLLSKGSPSSICPPVRPQLLGLSNLPANLSGVKFLQLPGQNSLLQIVPASALGLKPMDNKNVPNFVAVPVSLTSVAALPTGLAGGSGGKNKSGSRVQIDIPSKVFTQTQQQNLAQANSPSGGATGDQSKGTGPGGERKLGDTAESTAVSDDCQTKKKKKRKSRKNSDGSNLSKDHGTSPVNCRSSSMLVAPSPAPIVSSAALYPVQMVLNPHVSTGGNKATTQREQSPHSPSHLSGKASPGKLPGQSEIGEATGMLSAATPSNSENAVCGKSADDTSMSLGQPAGDSVSETGCTPAGDSVSETGCTPAWGKITSGTTVSPSLSPAEQVPTQQSSTDTVHPEEPQTSSLIVDDDSQGSGFDSLYLSSDSEVDVVGDASVGSPFTPNTVLTVHRKRDLSNRSRKDHKDCEQRRRNMLQEGYKELTKVLNASSNLPKALPKAQILSKTVKLIQYHTKVLPRLALILEKARGQHLQLQQQLHNLIQHKQREGVSLDVIQVVLDKAAAWVSQHPVCDASAQGQGANSEGEGNLIQSSHPCLSLSGPAKGCSGNNIHSITEVGVGSNKSRFVIEIDRGDEDEPVGEDLHRESSVESGSSPCPDHHSQPCQVIACPNKTPVNTDLTSVAVSPAVTVSCDTVTTAMSCDTVTTAMSCTSTNEIVARHQATVTDTTSEFLSHSGSDVAEHGQNSVALALNLGQASSSCDELDGVVSSETCRDSGHVLPGEGASVHVVNQVLDGGDGKLAVCDHEMEGIGLVITSVTSLQGNITSFHGDGVDQVNHDGDENTCENSCSYICD